jgi:hypothetical protein
VEWASAETAGGAAKGAWRPWRTAVRTAAVRSALPAGRRQPRCRPDIASLPLHDVLSERTVMAAGQCSPVILRTRVRAVCAARRACGY